MRARGRYGARGDGRLDQFCGAADVGGVNHLRDDRLDPRVRRARRRDRQGDRRAVARVVRALARR